MNDNENKEQKFYFAMQELFSADQWLTSCARHILHASKDMETLRLAQAKIAEAAAMVNALAGNK